MRKLLFFLCLVPLVAFAQDDYYFFTQEDVENIRTSSRSDWGKEIIAKLEQQVNERRLHPLRVPLLEGGHLHHYFCPVHNVMLEFNWDKPREHYCEMCGKHWENNNRFDWAWINRLHEENLKYLTASMYLYLATEDAAYAHYIRDMLLDYASKYPTYMEHNTNRVATTWYSGRMFGQSLDEAVWASDAARAFSVAIPVMKKEEIEKIKNGYMKVCAGMLLNRRGGGNWQVWHNSGLIALGIALQEDSIVRIALDDPQCGYHALMEKHVHNDGWWNEGSPTYHYYPLRAMLLSADAVRCRNIDLFDKKLYNMFASPAMGVYADLFFPAHNDGWYGESLIIQAKQYEIAYKRYRDPFLLNVLKRCYQHTDRNSVEALQNSIDLSNATPSGTMPSVCFEDVGFAVLRSKEKTVVLKYGPHGGGHGHPDKLSISIHDGKKEILPDMGTSAYGVPDFTQWYRKTLSHSTLTVDAADQKETTGKLLQFKPAGSGGFVEAESDGAYPGVKMSRSLSLKGNKLTDVFSATSDKEHVYDYVLILAEKPAFSEKGNPVVLEDAAVYKRISHPERRTAYKSVFCQLEGGTKIRIQSLVDPDFEIITGEAPGIPPRNPAGDQEYVAKPSYPVIIRTKDKDMKIKVEWEIK